MAQTDGLDFLSLPTLVASVLRRKGEELWRPCSPALLFASPPASTSMLWRPQLAGAGLKSICGFLLSMSLLLRMCFEYFVWPRFVCVRLLKEFSSFHGRSLQSLLFIT